MVQDHLLAVVHAQRGARVRIISARLADHGNDGATMKRTGKGKRKIDRSRADA